MSSKIVGNQYIYNGPGYLDGKIQPVESVSDLNNILLRQRFVGLTVTVIHPDGPDSLPADYILVQDPNEEPGVLMWVRKVSGGNTSVDTKTPEYITVTKDGDTYYVDAAGNLISDIEEIKDKVSELESGLTETNEKIVTEVERLDGRIDTEISAVTETIRTEVETINDRIDTEVSAITETINTEVETINDRIDSEVSALTEVINTEVERIDEKNSEQDSRIDEISEWHIEKLSDASGMTKYALVDGSGNTIGDTIDVTEEQYLESVIYIPSATQEDKDIDDTVIIGDPYLKFIWKYDIITYVAIKDWVNDYFAGNGINISDGHEISVKLAEVEEGNDNYLSVSSEGLKMNMFIEIDD